MDPSRDNDMETGSRQRHTQPPGESGRADSAGDLPENRIRGVFALANNTPLPRVNRRSLSAYHRHLAAHVSLPFVARCWEEVSPLESVSHIVTVVGFLDPADRRADISAGLRCTVQVDDRTVDLPLAELELANGAANSRLIEDYWYWFWNWRTGTGG